MNYYVDPNSIDWLTNGERGNAQNINRALYQYIEQSNSVFNTIKNRLKDGVEIFRTNIIVNKHSGGLVILDNNGSIDSSIQVGSIINIVCLTDLNVFLSGEIFINSNSETFEFKPGLYRLVKFDENSWAISN